MPQRPPREDKILSYLGTKNGVIFEEFFRELKMGRKSLSLGLAKIIEEDLVYHDKKTKKYFIRTEINNKVLLAPRKTKHNIMNIN